MCTLPKFAIITTLKRILNYGTKTTIFLWGLALTSQASVLAMSLLGVFQCSPVAYQWDSSIKGGSCSGPSSYLGLAYFTYAYSTALDVFFALYPVPHVMRLNMPLKTRISVSVSLSISWVGFGISIYKFSIFSRLGQIMAVDPTCKSFNSIGIYISKVQVNKKRNSSPCISLHDPCRRRFNTHHRHLTRNTTPTSPRNQGSCKRHVRYHQGICQPSIQSLKTGRDEFCEPQYQPVTSALYCQHTAQC